MISQYKKLLNFPETVTNIWTSFFELFSSVETIEDANYVIERYIDWLEASGKYYVLDEEFTAFQYAFNTALHSINYWSFLKQNDE